jgi:hypothetical protein
MSVYIIAKIKEYFESNSQYNGDWQFGLKFGIEGVLGIIGKQVCRNCESWCWKLNVDDIKLLDTLDTEFCKTLAFHTSSDFFCKSFSERTEEV